MIKKRLAIFASGSGTNAINLVNYFTNHSSIEIGILISNKKDAPVVEACEKLGLDVFVLDNEKANQGSVLSSICLNQGIDFVVLAGYLRKIPDAFIAEYPKQILNIHPSILPNYGGEGMYGMRVHEAVKVAGEKLSGMSIHLVNSDFDGGQLIAQFYCSISATDTPKDIARKVQILEHAYFPTVVENYIKLL
jgi:phosphoribosylglycinamide formyltransferase-1|tara:strand:- start:17773 stop:18348 length:576 start_codon:yes stop_codon:yes gene_type:complete